MALGTTWIKDRGTWCNVWMCRRTMLLTAITRVWRVWRILPALDRPVHEVLGIEHLAQEVKPANQRALEPQRIGLHAPAVNPSLGNDHIVSVRVDETDGAIVAGLVDRRGGVAGEVPDLRPPAPAGGGNRDAPDLGWQRAFLPGFRVEIDAVAGTDQARQRSMT